MASLKIVIAIPTIEARGDLWKSTATEWIRPADYPVLVVPGRRKGGWVMGLVEVWEQHGDADIFICGSDDIVPRTDWLRPTLDHLGKGECPVPSMFDPRMTTHGGTQDTYWDREPTEGVSARMTNFPILKGEWLSSVFPWRGEAPTHYFADNHISDCLRKTGIPLITCLDIKLTHTWDERGRGAGYGSEEARMQHDRAIYRSLT